MSKICPLLMGKGKSPEESCCREADCSWWDDRESACAMQSILSAIREITEEGRTSLDDIDRSIHKLTDYM